MTPEDTPRSHRALEVRNITKDYSGVPVLLGVSLSLSPGEVVGLVGHNGAGKSTLLKVLSGAHKPSSGDLLIDGEPTTFNSPADAIEHGVSTVYQELSLLENLTVAQNIWLGRELKGPTGMLDTAAMRAGARQLVAEFGIDVAVDRKVGDYPVAVRQLLEIAIASAKKTQYLLLDEPTTALEGEQISELLAYIRALARDRGIGVLIINHKLDELYEVADRITALMNGRLVIDSSVDQADRTEVIAAIAGHDYAEKAAAVSAGMNLPHHTVLEVDNLRAPLLRGVTFEARSAEILGIYGLGGSGRSETLRAIAGIEPAEAGTVRAKGEVFQPKRPMDAMTRGIAFLTEERKQDGIVPQMSGLLNAALPVLSNYTTLGWLNGRAMRQRTLDMLADLDLKGDPRQPVVSLSGGNQQKVLIARALAQEPDILLLDEPTKGVDIGAKSEIHHLLTSLAHDKGKAIVMVSSEEEEILEVADRVLVLAEGRAVAGPLPVADVTISTLRSLAWGEGGRKD